MDFNCNIILKEKCSFQSTSRERSRLEKGVQYACVEGCGRGAFTVTYRKYVFMNY